MIVHFKSTQTLFFILFIIITPIIASCSDESLEDVKEFLNTVGRSKGGAMLSDYYHFYGRGAEQELQINLEICKDKGWSDSEKNVSCLNFIKLRHTNENKIVSSYLLWLKNKIPKYSSIELVEIKKNMSLKYELITVNLDSIPVVFFRNKDPQKEKEFGSISINEIDKVSINDLFKDDLDSGFILKQIKPTL